MIAWIDNSDRNSAYFVGQLFEDGDTSIESAFSEMLAFLIGSVLGKGNARDFDRLLLEVNCGTGRVLVAATTEERRANGMIDGCTIRLQSIQDHWYDLLESGLSDQEFSDGIANRVTNLGRTFRQMVNDRVSVLTQTCSTNGFEYLAYGSEPGVVYVQEHFARPRDSNQSRFED